MRSSIHPRELFPGEAFKLVANIPYHITSPLLHAFLEGERPPELTVLLVQAEVAERVAAPPGRMSYLSVFVQNVAERRGRGPRPGGRLRAGARGRLGRPAPAAPTPSRPCRSARRASRSTASCRPASDSGASRSTTGSSRELPVDRETRSTAALERCGVDARASAADADASPSGRAVATGAGPGRRVTGRDAPRGARQAQPVAARRRSPRRRRSTCSTASSSCSTWPIGSSLLPGCSGLRVEGDATPRGAGRRAPTSPGAARRRPRGEPELVVPGAREADPRRRRAGRRLVGRGRRLAAGRAATRPSRRLRARQSSARCRDDRRRRAVLRRRRRRAHGSAASVSASSRSRRPGQQSCSSIRRSGCRRPAVFAELRPDEWGQPTSQRSAGAGAPAASRARRAVRARCATPAASRG